jgi:glutaredoxin
MKIKKYLPAIIIALVIIAILLIWGRQQNSSTAVSSTDKIFFYGDTCPHCKNVEEFMAANGTRNKLSFQELEVYNNQANAKLLGQTAQKCGLDTSAGIGVPFFYDGSKCLMGDQDIINYFKQL